MGRIRVYGPDVAKHHIVLFTKNSLRKRCVHQLSVFDRCAFQLLYPGFLQEVSEQGTVKIIMSRQFTDMLGREIAIDYPPRRIVSLVPSQTELLYDLGLKEEVVGITKFCVHPDEWFRSKRRVGGTKSVHIEIVKALEPDLIIANKEENTREQIEELSLLYPVWISDIKSIDEGLCMIREVGVLVGKEQHAAILAAEIAAGFTELGRTTNPKRVAYFIWRKPWMSVGGDTFINNMIERMGWENVLSDRQRYPEISLEELKDKQVDTVLLSSEPYPFKDAHVAEIKGVLPSAEVLLVDGEMFSWYGSRMKDAVGYLKELAGK
jgi:ABC-type Fe3+-hydroxamate transport system substrate-binding protein